MFLKTVKSCPLFGKPGPSFGIAGPPFWIPGPPYRKPDPPFGRPAMTLLFWFSDGGLRYKMTILICPRVFFLKI